MEPCLWGREREADGVCVRWGAVWGVREWGWGYLQESYPDLKVSSVEERSRYGSPYKYEGSVPFLETLGDPQETPQGSPLLRVGG